jgi:hypothetical protein
MSDYTFSKLCSHTYKHTQNEKINHDVCNPGN